MKPKLQMKKNVIAKQMTASMYVGESLLWKHQEPWQKELMIKYGNIMCLMDATYKTTRYDLPLFSCVRTNIGYCVIAEFIVQSEAIEYIIVIV